MKRPSYRAALRWILDNDDCEWLKDEPRIISVTACFVADMFDVSDEKVISDLARMAERK